jgi:hypothetical protein
MPQWEYRKVSLTDLPRRTLDTDLLNDLGSDGWELVCILENAVAYLKREIPHQRWLVSTRKAPGYHGRNEALKVQEEPHSLTFLPLPQWSYRNINLNDLPRRTEDIDVLTDAGDEGWELITITPNNIACLKRPIEGPALAEEAIPAARATRRNARANAR